MNEDLQVQTDKPEVRRPAFLTDGGTTEVLETDDSDESAECDSL